MFDSNFRLPADQASAPPPTKRPGRRRVLFFLAVAGLAAATGAGGALALQGGDSPAHTLQGTFVLADEDAYDTWCHETVAGYDDIHPATQVIVKDEAGATLGVTTLGLGRIAGRPRCQFTWEVEDLPERDFYTVEIGNRGPLTFSSEQLDDDGWMVSSSLGE